MEGSLWDKEKGSRRQLEAAENDKWRYDALVSRALVNLQNSAFR